MQMTAYELRISDWSSYVCSSDLHGLGIAERVDRALDVGHLALEAAQHVDDGVDLADVGEKLVAEALALGGAAHERSEEHTSELQSLMRISYAVFCLKKKHIKQAIQNHKTTQKQTENQTTYRRR